MIFKGFYSAATVKKCSFFTIASAKTDTSIQNNSGPPQGPVHPFGGRLSRGTHALRPQGGPAMSEQAVEERRRSASDIVWVVAYSILVLLVMLLWVYIPA